MIQLTAAEAAKILAERPAFVCKSLDVPFVMVLKTDNGICVCYQNNVAQKTATRGETTFTEITLFKAVLDVELKNGQHGLLIVVSKPEDSASGVSFYLVGETKAGGDATTAFLAYEAEKNRSIHVVSIIEDEEDKTIFSDARRFGKDSSKLLKSQLRMFLALAGVKSATRKSIITGGGFLPPTPNVEKIGGNEQ